MARPAYIALVDNIKTTQRAINRHRPKTKRHMFRIEIVQDCSTAPILNHLEQFKSVKQCKLARQWRHYIRGLGQNVCGIGCIYFAEKDCNNFLVVIDSHSKWLEVKHMTSTTSQRTIAVLRDLFSSYGLPEEVVSDNGPQFVSHDFTNFMNMNGIKHTLIPPYHPASNGAAERSVQILKQELRKQVASHHEGQLKLTIEHRLAHFLLTLFTV